VSTRSVDKSKYRDLVLPDGKVFRSNPETLRWMDAYLLVNTTPVPDDLVDVKYGPHQELLDWPVEAALKFFGSFRGHKFDRKTLFIQANYNSQRKMLFFDGERGKPHLVHVSTEKHWSEVRDFIKNLIGYAAFSFHVPQEDMAKMGLLNVGESGLPTTEDSVEEAERKIEGVKKASASKK